MDSHNATCSSRPEVPFTHFLAGLALWSVLKYLLEAFLQWKAPKVYEDLKLDIRKRYDLYFGTFLGTMYKVVSIVACTMAMLTVSPETDIMGFTRPLTAVEQWCWGCRAVIYIQELPYLTAIPELIIHHLLSIAGMIGILHYSIPRRQMYLFWGTLVSEFVGNTRRIMRFHRPLTPAMYWWFSLAMGATILGFRVTGCIVAMVWIIESGASGPALFVNLAGATIYMFYMLIMTWRELARAKIVMIDKSEPVQLVIAERWWINISGLIVGLGCVFTELSSLFIYKARVPIMTVGIEDKLIFHGLDSARIDTRPYLHDLACAVFRTVVAYTIGSFAVTRMLHLASKADENSKKQRWALMMLHYGLLTLAVAIVFSPVTAKDNDTKEFLGCMSLSFPLFDAFRHIGHYFDGTGPSLDKKELVFLLPTEPKSNPPVILETFRPNPEAPPTQGLLQLPLIASLLDVMLYGVIVVAYLTGLVDLWHAAWVGMAIHGMIQVEVHARRNDKTEKEVVWTRRLYALQRAIAIGVLQYSTLFGELRHIVAPNALLAWCTAFVWWAPGALSRPRRKPKTSRKDSSDAPSDEKITKASRKAGRKAHLGKIAAVVTTLVLIVVLVLATYLDAMPKTFDSIEEARRLFEEKQANRVRGGGLAKFIDAMWSWRFAVPTLGLALVPVVAVQLKN